FGAGHQRHRRDDGSDGGLDRFEWLLDPGPARVRAGGPSPCHSPRAAPPSPPAHLPSCSPPSSGAFGILTHGKTQLHVFNGTVAGMDIGIWSKGALGAESVRVLGNAEVGIDAGESSTVTDSIVEGNGFSGIEVGSGSVIRGCTVNGNGDLGIQAV